MRRRAVRAGRHLRLVGRDSTPTEEVEALLDELDGAERRMVACLAELDETIRAELARLAPLEEAAQAVHEPGGVD